MKEEQEVSSVSAGEGIRSKMTLTVKDNGALSVDLDGDLTVNDALGMTQMAAIDLVLTNLMSPLLEKFSDKIISEVRGSSPSAFDTSGFIQEFLQFYKNKTSTGEDPHE